MNQSQTTKHIDQLNKSYKSLIKIKENNEILAKVSKILNIISKIEECLLQDNNDESSLFVDAFCELNILKEFNNLIEMNIKEITFALLKSFSILILSISKIHLLYFFYSSPVINKIITIDYQDDDFLSYQINFMKSLSLKLDKDTINFFFDKKNNYFPLLEKTFRLRTHEDGMINNVVRNIILTLLKIDDAPLRKYFITYPIIIYFPNLILNLKPLFIALCKNDNENIKDIHDDIIDSLYYIQDILSLQIESVNNIIYNCMLTQLILPLGNIIISTLNYHISRNNAVYFILLILSCLKDKEITNVIFYLLFVENIKHDVMKMINIASYDEFNKPFQVELLNNLNESQPIDEIVDIDIYGFLLKDCGYETNSSTPIINKLIDLEQLNNNKENTNDICWNIKLFLKNKDDALVLLIGLLIYNFGDRELNMTLVGKSSLFKDYNFKIKEKKNKLIDYEPDEQLDSPSNESNINDNSNLFDTLFPLITVESQFRYITTKVILTILSGIICQCKAKLTDKNIEQISELYCSIITAIKSKMSIVENYTSVAYEFFIEIYNDYKNNSRKSFENIIMKPWILLPYDLAIKNPNYPSMLHYNKTDYDSYQILLLIFMSLYDYQAMLYNQPFITEEFPIPYEGKEFNIGDIPECNYEYSYCIVKKENETIKSRMIQLSNYLYLGKQGSNKDQYIIYTKIPLRRVLFKSDTKEGKVLLLIRERNIDERNKTQMQNSIEMTFKSDDYALSMLAFLNQQKITIVETEYLMLDSYLEDIFMMFIK